MRYGDTHTAVMKHVETLKTSTCCVLGSQDPKLPLHASPVALPT